MQWYIMKEKRIFSSLQPIAILVTGFLFLHCADSSSLSHKLKKTDQYAYPVGGFEVLQMNIIYPVEALRKRIEGRVIVSVLFSDKGEVKRTRVLKALPGGCTKAAIAAIKRTRWKPTMREGKPIAAWIAIPVSFKLPQ